MRKYTTDYTLEVCCDHYLHPGVVAPLRTTSLVFYLPKPSDTWGFLCWREAENPQDPDYPEALQTYFGRLMELERGMGREAAEEVLRDPEKRAALLTNRKTGEVMQGTNWRFWCRDCGDTLPFRQTRIEPIFEKLRGAGVPRVTLAELRKYALA